MPSPISLDEDELDLFAIFRLFRRRIWQIVFVTILITAAAVPQIVSIEPVYHAESRLLIQSALATKLTRDDDSRLVQLNLTTEVERLLSRETAVRVIEQLNLAQLPEFNAALRDVPLLDQARQYVRGFFLGEEEAEPLPIDTIDRIIPAFQSALVVARNPYSDVIQIGFESRDPELAALVPQTLLKVYLNERENHLGVQIQEADGWLRDRIEEQTRRLFVARDRVREFDDETKAGASALTSSAADTMAALTAQREALAQKRSEISEALASLNAAKTPEEKLALAHYAMLPELSRELLLQRMELDQLSRVYGSKNEKVVEAQRKILETEARIEIEVDRYAQSLRTDAAALDREEASASAKLQAVRTALAREEAAELRRGELLRAADAEQLELDRLEMRQRSLLAEGKLPIADVEVLSPATIPLWPKGRGRLFYGIATVLVASVIGLTVACFLELLDRSVRTHQQLRKIPGIVPAGMVPAAPRRAMRDIWGHLSGGTGGMFDDAVFGLAFELEKSNGGSMPHSTLVTSPLPGDGKSVIAAALALKLAAGGHDVLLVDADVRHGRVGKILCGPESPGLADFVAGECPLPDVVHHHSASGLNYIPRGAAFDDAFHDRNSVIRIMQFAHQRRQIVIFDSAPVLAKSETAILASVAERTLLVVRWGKSTASAVAAAAERLQNDRRDGPLVVINRVNPRRHALYGFKDSEIYSAAVRRYQTGTS